MSDDDRKGPQEKDEDEAYETKLQTLLQEIRIILPGTQVLGGFLITVPFQARYEKLSTAQRDVFILTFFSTMLSVVCFLMPAIYHRLAMPVHGKKQFIELGTRFLVAGFVPLTVSTALSVQLVTSLVLGEGWASFVSGVVAALVAAAWWILPKVRLHERVKARSGI